MLGFGKKKNKAANEDTSKNKDEKSSKEAETGKPKEDNTQQKSKPSVTKKKKLISVKRILIFFTFLCVGISAYFIYTMYFSSASKNGKLVYKQVTFEHINLSEEILKFSFDYFTDLYAVMITVNDEINLMEKEILRIEVIAVKYPEQIKIAQKEKKLWEKTRGTLQKTFLKVEKPVKETYVLFQVNKPDGLARIEQIKSQLTQTAQASVVPAQELTKRIKSNEVVPEGFFQGYIYKFKKKFL